MKNSKQTIIVNFLKNYGFVYEGSEIYNGLSNTWDFGNVGVLLKQNIKTLWWNYFVTQEKNIIGLDSSIIYNPEVWKASGHLANFSDPLIDCKNCKSRFRVDQLIQKSHPEISVSENNTNAEFLDLLTSLKITCEKCNAFNWTEVRNFNLMFKTFNGVIENNENCVYLRPETAQGIFINFKNILRTSRKKIPFGIAQIGKSFRNEITPGNFIFRTKEFEQMEIEFFIEKKDSIFFFTLFQEKINNFLINICEIKNENLKIYDHPKDKLSHYSSKTIDFEYNFPHGWGELCGLADRGDYDLTTHEKYSKKNLSYLNENNEKMLPFVIEPSLGVERLFYAIICNHYKIEKLENGERELLTLPLKLSPYKICIMPLNNQLINETMHIYESILKANISACFENSGSIGKRYRRQDAIGTKYCLTYDFNSKENQTVTIRERDSMIQETIKISELNDFFIKTGIIETVKING